MSELIELVTRNDDGEDLRNAYVSSGLAWAIKFAESLIPRLHGTKARVVITGWGVDGATGLFFQDEIQGLAVRVGPNVGAGCGRVFWGKGDDFEYPSRLPKDRIANHNFGDFDDDNIRGVVDSAVAFFTSP